MSNQRRRLAAIAIVLLALGLAWPVPSAEAIRARPLRSWFIGALTDLDAEPDPFDHAAAFSIVRSGRHGTRSVLFVGGIKATPGSRFGAHVHVGPCVAGDGAAAGPHYNATGGETVSPLTEVWLDLTVQRSGIGFSYSSTPFKIRAGDAQSIVIHERGTDPSGGAGARLACLPLR